MQDSYHREHIYFLPIGGTAMASLAGLLQLSGHRVEGVDSQLYPPMSTLLEELGIPVRIGYDAKGPPEGVDRVVVGNAVPASNPEVQAVLRRGLPHLSQAEAVAHYLLATGRRTLVVAGTHGKTTTTSLLSWILEAAGTDPSYLVGGLLRWNRRSFRLGRGPWMAIEGDEYNTAFFDRGPKFLHYRPHVFVLGPVEFDHADIYRDLDAVLTAFRAGAAQVPRTGTVVVNAWSETALSAARDAAAPVLTVGSSPGCDMQITDICSSTDGARATLHWHGARATLEVPLSGHHNVHNAAMAMAAALVAEVPMDQTLAALATFPGVARRMEVVGEACGVIIVDDFAHHPTAVAATIAACRDRWPDRRLVVAFEPRSLTAARRMFQDQYAAALAGADVVVVAAPFHRDRLPPEDLIDRDALAQVLLGQGVVAIMPVAGEDPVAQVAAVAAPGDLVVGCSSGSFDAFHRRLLKKLTDRADPS